MLYIQYFVEDASTSHFIHGIMPKIAGNRTDIKQSCKGFHGLGKIPKGNNVSEIKTGFILNDLRQYLRAYDKALQKIPNCHPLIVVVLDNDSNNKAKYSAELKKYIADSGISSDSALCLAVEELEAWLLGDRNALERLFPKMNKNVLESYVQDSICGTWEVLANVVYEGGLQALKKKDRGCYRTIGKMKCNWAKQIAAEMEIEKNISPSFQCLLRELNKRMKKKRLN